MSGTTPPEILDMIISLVDDKHDLRAVCLTHSFILPIGQRYLYRSLSLENPVTNILFSLSILRNQALANHVRSLRIWFFRMANFPLQVTWERVSAPSYTRLVYRALRTMRKLTKLEFRTDQASSWTHDNLSSCTFPLRSLHLHNVERLDCLEYLPMVEELSISAGHGWGREAYEDARRLASDMEAFLPRLSTLSVWDFGFAELLLPGRPVVAFENLGSHDVESFEPILPFLELSAGPIEVLSLEFIDMSIDTLQGIAQHLPHLLELKFTLYQPGVEEEYESDEEYVFGEDVLSCFEDPAGMAALHAFRRLSKLTIHLCEYDQWIAWKDDSDSFVGLLGDACPTLTEVYLEDWGYGSKVFHVQITHKRIVDPDLANGVHNVNVWWMERHIVKDQ